MEHSIIDYILYNDNTHDAVKYSEEYNKISSERMKIHDKLESMLTEEQKKVFNEYVNSELGEIALSNDAYFKLGLKVGVRLVSECMFDEK